MPHTVGHLEVLRVLRVLPRPDSQGSEEPEIELFGVPASANSTVNSATISFVRTGLSRPEPVLDRERSRMLLFYTMNELADVSRIVRSRKERLCYLWRSNDGRHALAWLITMP